MFGRKRRAAADAARRKELYELAVSPQIKQELARSGYARYYAQGVSSYSQMAVLKEQQVYASVPMPPPYPGPGRHYSTVYPAPEAPPELVAAPIRAWRAWRLTGHEVYGGPVDRLRSVANPVIWPAGKKLMTAICLNGHHLLTHGADGCGDVSPRWACTCGIYACKTDDELDRQIARDMTLEIGGVVLLSGKIIEHERGYRAQYAQIEQLFALNDNGKRWLTSPAAKGYLP